MMDEITMVREQVARYQVDNNLSDQQMAEIIGCSRPLYQRTRTGKVPVGGRFIKGALKLLDTTDMTFRQSTISRQTDETKIEIFFNIDGTGKWDIITGIPLLNHFLAQLAKHGKFDITLKASGDDTHHIIEDVAICLGKVFADALGDKKGIERMAQALVPMDETLTEVALDISGRGYAVIDLALTGNDISGFPSDMARHFLESFAMESRITLHARIIRGTNDHHKVEAIFKGLGRALDMATRIDQRISTILPTTKGYLEN